MSGTPIFEQLCRELAAIGEPEVRARAIERGSDAQQPEHAQLVPTQPLVPSQTRTSPETSVLVVPRTEQYRRAGLLLFTLDEVVGPGGQSVEVFRPVAVTLGDVLPCGGYLDGQQAHGVVQIAEPGNVDEWVSGGVGTRSSVRGPLSIPSGRRS